MYRKAKGGTVMYYKKIEGKLCYLSPINQDDYELYTRWLNDLDISIGLMTASKIITPEKEREILAHLQNTEYNFAIVDRQRHTLIGNIGILNIDTLNRCAEIGVFIGKKEDQSKGYGQESLNLILDFGFNILNFHNMYLKVYDYNKIAISCYEKVGFKEAGRLRETKIIAGQKFDTIYMDMLASEFKSPVIADIVKKKNQVKK